MAGDDSTLRFELHNCILVIMPSESFAHARDAAIRNAYNEAYRWLSDDSVRHLVFDFSELQWFGSTFVGIMIRLAKKARLGNGEAALCHMSETTLSMLQQLMLLENTKTDFFWRPFDTRADAIEWLESRPDNAVQEEETGE